MRFAPRGCPVMLATGMLMIAGCSGKLTQPSGALTQFKGSVMGPLGIGTITVGVATSTSSAPPGGYAAGATVSAGATVRLSSGFQVVYLRGTYDPAAHVLALAGSGWTLGGTLSGGVLRGNFTVTGGSGVFIALPS